MKFKYVYWVSLIAIAIVWTNTLFTNDLDENDLTYYSGTFNTLQYHKSRGNSVSFSLYLNEYENHFKISAEYVMCFEYRDFELRVDQGDSLTVGMASRDGLIRKGSIAAINSKWHSFFDLECRNKKAGSNKILTSVLYGFMILILSYFYFKKEKQRQNKM